MTGVLTDARQGSRTESQSRGPAARHQSRSSLTVERGVGQEGGCPVNEAAARPGLKKGLSGGWQRGWGRERSQVLRHKCDLFFSMWCHLKN